MQQLTMQVVLFVGTKKQAADGVAEEAVRSGQYFINHRWLAELFTNWEQSKKSYRLLERNQTYGRRWNFEVLPKKEVALLEQTTRTS